MSFAFYDLETTGRSPAYDHPLQFAAILTDDDLRPVERINLRCRLAPHVLPSPGALAVTGVSPDQLIDPSLPSWFEMMAEVQQIVDRWSPATWTGFNSIRFDEQFLRQSFYQTLQPEIYATQGQGNTRLDVLWVVYAAYARAPNVLSYPQDDTGKASFKLDLLAPANGFGGHNAHDALGDVEATIYLLNLIRTRAPHLWREVLANLDKSYTRTLLQSGEPLEFITRAGGGPPQPYLGVGCGIDAKNANTAGFFDVRMMDPRDCFDLADDDLMKLLVRSPRVVRRVKINETPMIFPATGANAQDWQRCSDVAEHTDFQRRVGIALAQETADKYHPAEPGDAVRVEDRIFEGFYTSGDKLALSAYQNAEGSEARLSVVAQFEDSRLRQLGMRAALLGGGEGLSSDAVKSGIANILSKWRAEDAPRNGWLTLDAAETEIVELLDAGRVTEAQAADLRAFIAQRVATLESGRLPR